MFQDLFHNIEIDHCYFEDFSSGIFFGASGTSVYSTNLRFHHNYLYGGSSNCSYTGVKVYYAKDIWVTDNKFRKISFPAPIELDNNSSYKIENFYFCRNLVTEGETATAGTTNQNFMGVYISADDSGNIARNIVVSDNVFDSNTDTNYQVGMQMHDLYVHGHASTETVYGITITGNVFRNFTNDQSSLKYIYLVQGHNIVFANNVILDANTGNAHDFANTILCP